jgi:hypothetical protein
LRRRSPFQVRRWALERGRIRVRIPPPPIDDRDEARRLHDAAVAGVMQWSGHDAVERTRGDQRLAGDQTGAGQHGENAGAGQDEQQRADADQGNTETDHQPLAPWPGTPIGPLTVACAKARTGRLGGECFPAHGVPRSQDTK